MCVVFPHLWPNVHLSYQKKVVGFSIARQLCFHPHDGSVDTDTRSLGQKQQGYVCHDNLSEMQVCPCDGHLAHELQPLGCLLRDEWVSHSVIMIYLSRGSLLSVGHRSTLQVCTNYDVNTGCFFFPSTPYRGIEKQPVMEIGKISQWGGFRSFYLCLQMTSCLQISCHVFYFL